MKKDFVMKKYHWEAIVDFRSYDEFNRLVDWVNEQVQHDLAEKVSVEGSYHGRNFTEKWFLYKESGEIWRIVWPDVPFRGVFEKVK